MLQGADVTIRPAIRYFDDESVLLTGARNGDVTCFGTLLSRYKGKIFESRKTSAKTKATRKKSRKTRSGKSLQHLEDFKGASRFYTWLVRIGGAA